MEFAGRLASFSSSSLLQWAENERRSGVLVVRRSRREKRVSFRGGRVVGCRSNLIQETFGRYLVDRGLVRPDALARVLSHTRSSSTPTGQAMVELGILPEAIVEEQLELWISESVQDLCLWSRGVFVFHEHEPERFPLEVAVPTLGISLEGARWIDEHRRLRELLPDDGVVLDRGPSWPGRGLHPFEEKIARQVNGETALGTARGAVGGVDFPFLEAIGKLIESRVLSVVGHEPVVSFDSREVDLADLIGELEARSSGPGRHDPHALLPSDVVERLVPVWLQRPEPSELSKLAPSLRAFVDGFDGHARLGELFGRDVEQLADETDLLFLHLEQGTVALFPSPLSEYSDAAGVERALREAGLGGRREGGA